MFPLFNKKIKRIDTPKTFLGCIQSLRKLRLPVPMTEAYEDKLRGKGQHLKEIWYTSQGEHWEGWLGEYNGGGFYGRKDHNRTAEFTYNHIMCPPMLIWLAETVGIDENTIANAIKDSLATDKYQEQCGVIRKAIGWSEIEKAILSKLIK